MEQAGKLIFIAGLAIVVLGGVLWALGSFGFRGLPGDIRYQSGNVRIYFPVVTCIVLSIILTLLFSLWRWLGR